MKMKVMTLVSLAVLLASSVTVFQVSAWSGSNTYYRCDNPLSKEIFTVKISASSGLSYIGDLWTYPIQVNINFLGGCFNEGMTGNSVSCLVYNSSGFMVAMCSSTLPVVTDTPSSVRVNLASCGCEGFPLGPYTLHSGDTVYVRQTATYGYAWGFVVSVKAGPV